MKHIEIDPIGSLELDEKYEWHVSAPIPLPILDGRLVTFVVEGYYGDASQKEFGEAIRNLLSATPSVLKAATEHLYQYYLDENDNGYPSENPRIEILSPDDVWRFVEYGKEVHIVRRSSGDGGVYASFECECRWEEEHGLQIVLRNGRKVCKVGPYDGHVTNSDASGDPSLEDVIYDPVGYRYQ